MAAVVARVCDEIWAEGGFGEAVLRLERLQLELGAFALERLEAEVPEALEQALREALRQALAAAIHNPSPEARWLSPSAARLERLTTFLQSGLWPFQSNRPGISAAAASDSGASARPAITSGANASGGRGRGTGSGGWASDSDPEALDPARQLALLLRDDPAGLLALLRRLASQRSALERLLLQIGRAHV